MAAHKITNYGTLPLPCWLWRTPSETWTWWEAVPEVTKYYSHYHENDLEHKPTETPDDGITAESTLVIEDQEKQEDSAKDYETAFPIAGENHIQYGMTIRDYFAAKALSGMLASPDCGGSHESIAKHAYKYADALMKARNKP